MTRLNRALLLPLLLLAVGCTSFEHQKKLAGFDDALEALKAGKIEKAKARLEPLCKKKHKASCALLGKKVEVQHRLPIMQGVTTINASQFVVAQEGKAPLRFLIRQKGQMKISEPNILKEVHRYKTSRRLWHIAFEDLKAGASYKLFVTNEMGELLDARRFRLFHKKEEKPKVSLLSCMKDSYKDIKDIWSTLEKRKSTLIFMIGDNSYLDQGIKIRPNGMDPQTIWRRHMETRFKLPIFRWESLVPVYGVWDDHDYGKNNGGAEYSNKEISAQIFRSFFPLYFSTEAVEKGPGVAFSFQWQKQNFLFLDNRSFRDKEHHLGEKQIKWVGEQLSEDHLNWLVSGDQFFGAYHSFESFEGNHKKEFKDLLSLLNKKKARYLFISGDRHMSELMKIPTTEVSGGSYEVTSSPVHSSVYEDALERDPNPHRIHGVDGTWNFVTLEAQKKGVWEVKSWGQKGNILFQEKLNLK